MADIDINSLEPNSHVYKAEKANQENNKNKSAPIIGKDKIVSTKKPLSKKFAETFISEDAKDVKSWLIMDVIIPGIQSTIMDILSMMFYGEVNSRGRGRRYDRDNGRVNYGDYYKGSSSGRSRKSRNDRDNRYDSDDHVDFRNIVLRYREDAERIIEEMRGRIHTNNSVSIAELLDLVGVTGRYTDNNWGWDNERDIGIRRVSTGFLIDVSEPKILD